MTNDALVHDLRNELHSALLWVDLKVGLKEIPKDLGAEIKGRLGACADKVGGLATVRGTEQHVSIPGIQFLEITKSVCERNAAARMCVSVSHALKPTTHVGIESVATLELIVSEILRNSIKVGASNMAVHISDSDDMIRIYFRDNGPGVSLARKDFMMLPVAKRGNGGEGVKLLEGLVASCGGAISWHSISSRGMMVRVLLPKTVGESVRPLELNDM